MNEIIDERIPCVNFITKYFDLVISLGRIEKACICIEKPEKPRAKAVRAFLCDKVKILQRYIIDAALPISHTEAKTEVKASFLKIAENKLISAQKKIIKAPILMQDNPASFIDAVKSKLCLEIYVIFARVVFFGRNIIPTIKADNNTVEYKNIPSNIFP